MGKYSVFSYPVISFSTHTVFSLNQDLLKPSTTWLKPSNMLIGFRKNTLWPQPLWSSVFGFPVCLHPHLGFHFLSALSFKQTGVISIYLSLISVKGLLQELFLLPWKPFPPRLFPSLCHREVPHQLLILSVTFLTSLTSWNLILAPHVPPLPHLVTIMQITVHVLECFCYV